jgi:hypothetical protein
MDNKERYAPQTEAGSDRTALRAYSSSSVLSVLDGRRLGSGSGLKAVTQL